MQKCMPARMRRLDCDKEFGGCAMSRWSRVPKALLVAMALSVGLTVAASAQDNCSDIWTCAASCGLADASCLDTCSNDGCTEALNEWDSLLVCAVNACASDCLFDLSSPACQSCLYAQCFTELTSCQAGTCSPEPDPVPALGPSALLMLVALLAIAAVGWSWIRTGTADP